MTDPLFQGALESARAFNAFAARHAGTVQALELPGASAYALAVRPDLVFSHRAFYFDAASAETEAPRVEAFFRALGIRGWRCAVPEQDRALRRVLERHGYTRSYVLPVLGAWLDALPEGSAEGVERPGSLAELVAINELAYPGDFGFEEGFGQLPADAPELDVVLARGPGGEPASVGLSHDVGALAGIYMVATAPAHRGRGHATRVMHALHAGARARGRQGVVLQASSDGYPLYKRLGYRDVGELVQYTVRLTD